MKSVRLSDGVYFAQLIESVCPQYGYHVALTGGCLYKDGYRKDIDLIIYRIRQVEKPDFHGLIHCLENEFGFSFLTIIDEGRWCIKAQCYDVAIDLLFPECMNTNNSY